MINTKTTLKTIQSNWNEWIAENTEFTVVKDNDIQVLTSFTDYFDDGIFFDILSNSDDTFTLTDKGYTIWNMKMNGIDLSKAKTTRNKLFTWYLKSFNFKLINNNIQKNNVKMTSISQSITDFIQLLLRISDLGATSKANTRGIFFDDAKQYFDSKKDQFVFSTHNIIEGKTKQQYIFEYNFTPKLGTNKMTKLYNTLSKNTMEAIIGIHIDTQTDLKDNYPNPSFNILVNEINDKSQQYVAGLEEHGISVVNFQNKEEVARNFSTAA